MLNEPWVYMKEVMFPDWKDSIEADELSTDLTDDMYTLQQRDQKQPSEDISYQKYNINTFIRSFFIDLLRFGNA